ncbi:hypothetical protein [Tautonia marina]|uniref:hypothetical protein n=1 Tax=Tautonia marina TaxID=2653855 RepID=UPI00126059D1|nr:hypothetical protein [Tautonia marina]
MFTFRRSQLDQMSSARRAALHRRIAELYRRHLPEITTPWDDSELLRRVEQADRKAISLGIQTERGISQYVGFALVNGPDFDEHPQIKAYFQAPGSTPDEKMQMLTDRCAALEQAQRTP